jgi:hypothetical protein
VPGARRVGVLFGRLSGPWMACRRTVAALSAWLRPSRPASPVNPVSAGVAPERDVTGLQRAMQRERIAAKVARREAAVLAQELRKAKAEIDRLRSGGPSGYRGCPRALIAELEAARLELRRLVDPEKGGSPRAVSREHAMCS